MGRHTVKIYYEHFGPVGYKQSVIFELFCEAPCMFL